MNIHEQTMDILKFRKINDIVSDTNSLDRFFRASRAWIFRENNFFRSELSEQNLLIIW